jgi:acyl-CoA reductase-like NAD-dependent aldehyde dehydrogenase
MQRHGLLIGGEWRDTDRRAEIRNPHTGDVVGVVPWAGERELEDAIHAAESAFAITRTLSRRRRAAILAAVASGIAERRRELVETMAREAGKPVKYADGEVVRAITTFTLAAEEAKRLTGEMVPVDIEERTEGYVALTERFPIGPIAAISPFNFPLNLVAHKVAPCLATGNTMVLKPPPQAPITSLLLGEIVTAAGAPAGSLNIVHCEIPLAERLATDERFKMLSFTGSARVGWQLKAKAGKKKILLELGGNAGAIVHRDADLDWAAERCAVGGFAYAGQICIKVQRLYVDASIYDDFMRRFLARVGALVVGDPLDPATDLGALIDPAAAARVEEWIAEARDGGARIVAGGRRRGGVIDPTVIEGATATMRVKREEVFGPVVTVDRYAEFGEAVAAVNDSPYGLQAGVFTRDLGRAIEAFRHLEVGGVIVNDYPTLRVDNYPYGGVKDSGFGREGVRYAMEAMTELRTLVVNPGR